MIRGDACAPLKQPLRMQLSAAADRSAKTDAMRRKSKAIWTDALVACLASLASQIQLLRIVSLNGAFNGVGEPC